MSEKELLELVRAKGKVKAVMKGHPEFGEWVITFNGFLKASNDRGYKIITDPDDWEIL